MISATDITFGVVVLAELLVVLFGSLLTAVCLLSYRRTRSVHFRNATFGVVMITIGAVGGSISRVGFHAHRLFEPFLVQSVESLLIAAGLGLLFHSIYVYRPDRSGPNEAVALDFDARDD